MFFSCAYLGDYLLYFLELNLALASLDGHLLALQGSFLKDGRVRIRLLTANGAAFRSKEFAAACKALGVQHKFTRPYLPQTDGKVERLIQSALREWAYGWTYQNSAERAHALASWQHHYNWHRPHSGIGHIAAMSRLKSANNLLTVHSDCSQRCTELAIRADGHAADAATCRTVWPVIPQTKENPQ